MKLGFIGMGNMPYAILKGILKAEFISPEDILAFDLNTEKLCATAKETGIGMAASSVEIAEKSDIIVMAVKPAVVPSVVAEINEAAAGKAILSIAYNIGFADYKEKFGCKARVQFIVPNIPCMALAGMTLFEDKTDFTAEELAFVHAMFEAVGKITTLPMKLMPVAGGLTSCGPAFAAMIAESFADAVVYYGLPYDTAYELAAQLLTGTGSLLSETGLIPAKLKNNVCSPGGYTIRGVKSLEEDGLRAAIIHAVEKTITG